MATEYRSTDPGAPVITYNTPGSVIAVLRACLVDGYGSKAPAGWSEPFTGTNIAVFQNSIAAGATGCCVRVDDTSTGSGYAPIPYTAYASMSDIDTGLKPSATFRLFRRPSSQNHPVEWILWADEATFYIQMWQPAGTNNYRSPGGAGDIESFQPGDAFRYGVFGSSGDSWQSSDWFADMAGSKGGFINSGIANYTGVSLASDHTGIASATSYACMYTTWPNRAIGCLDYPPRPSLNGGPALTIPYMLTRNNVLRGRMRGLYLALSNESALDVGDAGPIDVVAPGSVFSAMKAGNLSTTPLTAPQNATMWVETGLPW